MQARKIIIGNWKMNGTPEMARSLAAAVAKRAASLGSEVVICPPATLLHAVSDAPIAKGGQDCSAEAAGAFTGDVSATMLKEAGCDYVIVGHSERRQHHGETDARVRAKAAQAVAAGLVPVICVGETLAEREAGREEQVVATQVAGSVPPGVGEGSFILAYEPVWAIGTGKTPTNEDIRAMHAHILTVSARETGLAQSQISVLYGGSVKSGNAKEILAINGVAGVLVGGASLVAEEFCKIIEVA